MGKRKLSIISIVFYALAGILAIYMFWSIVNINKMLVDQQVVFSGNEFNIINYYATNAGVYGIYAIIIFALGWILQKMSPIVTTENVQFGQQQNFNQFETITVDTAEVEETEEVEEISTDKFVG